MPRPSHFSIDLPSAKHSEDNGARDSGVGSDLELDDLGNFQLDPKGEVSLSTSITQPSWKSMPHKGQLAILCLSRFADFFQMACLQAIMFHQLKSYDRKVSDATISWQAGLLQGSFTAAQSLSAILWGRVADAPWGGRKRVLLAGFVGTGITCIGVALSKSFVAAMLWRLLAGTLNGTITATRTMVAETVERKYHSRAFMLLPLAYSIANILGPILGASLVDPTTGFPNIFGAHSILGGKKGVSWMKKFPYALPNLLSAAILFVQALVVYLGLVETLASRRYARDLGVETATKIRRKMPCIRRRRTHYTRLSVNDALLFDAASSPTNEDFPRTRQTMSKQVLPFNRIFTQNVLVTLLANGFLHFHLGAYSTLWPTFLSTSRNDSSTAKVHQRLPFVFTGGLAFVPSTVGTALAIIGIFGVTLQLSVYPHVDRKFGVARSFRYALVLFPLAYFLVPFLALIPSNYGFQLWLSIGIVLLLQVTGWTFALAGSIILTNNCSPHPSVLATIHGIGTSTASVSKTLGSFFGGMWFALGLEHGVVGTAWWVIAAISVLGWISSFWVRNGDGHEIVLSEEGTDGLLSNEEELKTT